MLAFEGMVHCSNCSNFQMFACVHVFACFICMSCQLHVHCISIAVQFSLNSISSWRRKNAKHETFLSTERQTFSPSTSLARLLPAAVQWPTHNQLCTRGLRRMTDRPPLRPCAMTVRENFIPSPSRVSRLCLISSGIAYVV